MAPSVAGVSMFCRTMGMLLFVCNAVQWTSGDALIEKMRVKEAGRSIKVSTRTSRIQGGR